GLARVLGDEAPGIARERERAGCGDAPRGEVRGEPSVARGARERLLLRDAEEGAAAARERDLDVGVDAALEHRPDRDHVEAVERAQAASVVDGERGEDGHERARHNSEAGRRKGAFTFALAASPSLRYASVSAPGRPLSPRPRPPTECPRSTETP